MQTQHPLVKKIVEFAEECFKIGSENHEAPLQTYQARKAIFEIVRSIDREAYNQLKHELCPALKHGSHIDIYLEDGWYIFTVDKQENNMIYGWRYRAYSGILCCTYAQFDTLAVDFKELAPADALIRLTNMLHGCIRYTSRTHPHIITEILPYLTDTNTTNQGE